MNSSRRSFLGLAAAGAAFAQQQQAAEPEIEWIDAKKLTVEGLGFADLKSPYDRLPARAEGVVREAVWNLSRNSAGVAVRFFANSPVLHARWTRIKKNLAGPNMTGIGASGLDLYTRTSLPGGTWRWLAVGTPKAADVTTDAALVQGIPEGEREYLLYLPLYNGVTSVEIGVVAAKGSDPRIRPAGPRAEAKRAPIVFYGTSITQGASATRPGMAHTAILGRMFDRPVINLGFSGNGKMEAEVTKFLAEIDAAVFVIDCLPNMNAAEVTERTEPCVRTLRAAHPKTPILLVEDRNFPSGFLIRSRREHNASSQAALRAAYQRLVDAKTGNLHYLEGALLLDPDGEDTTDGSHPSDLGFVHHARAFERVLRPLLTP